MRDEDVSDVPCGFVLGVRVGGGWGDRLGWRKVFEGKSWRVFCWALLNLDAYQTCERDVELSNLDRFGPESDFCLHWVHFGQVA